MVFKNINYVICKDSGYIEYPKTYEKHDHSNYVNIHKDDYGHVIRIETELTYRKSNIDFISKGELDYFISTKYEEYFDLKYIIAELLYQSYSRQAGYIYFTCSEIPKLLPSIFNLYQKLKQNHATTSFKTFF